MQYFFFILLYFYFANWRQVHTWFRKPDSGRNILAGKATDKKISDFIFKTTQVSIDHVYIAPSKSFFAFCGGFTKHPILVISKGAYASFKEDALEWLVLHEMGHHVLEHAFGILMVQFSYAIIGGYILFLVHVVPLVFILPPVLAISLAIASIQTNKIFDIYANTYAVRRLKNPLGMKDGALCMMQQLRENGFTKDTIIMKLFYPWNYSMWHRTIRDAEKEMKLREKGKG